MFVITMFFEGLKEDWFCQLGHPCKFKNLLTYLLTLLTRHTGGENSTEPVTKTNTNNQIRSTALERPVLLHNINLRKCFSVLVLIALVPNLCMFLASVEMHIVGP